MPSFSLAELAEIVCGTLVPADCAGIQVSTLVNASKQHKPGSLFVAIPGVKFDGHRFIEEAFAHGAVAAVVTDAAALNGRPGIVVRDSRRALSRMAALFAGDASRSMQVVGVTGTNGKTTTTFVLHQIFGRLGKKALRMGTLGSYASGVIDDPDTLTTPDSIYMHETMRRALSGGVDYCVMETSSHALAQARLDHVDFNLGIFTNLTRDHLDYHQTMEGYFEAKKYLFALVASSTKKRRVAVVNLDGAYGDQMHGECLSYGLQTLAVGASPKASVRILSFRQGIDGSVLTLSYEGGQYSIRSGLIGKHNAQNLAGCFAAGVGFGFTAEEVSEAMQDVSQVPGRLQQVTAPGFGIYVDYAHTPDALENVLVTLRDLVKNQLWVVFGCGGDRDRGKRPQMAAISRRLADKVVVTSDNPRTEDPQAIIRDILAEGCQAEFVDPDRVAAIHHAVTRAQPGDIVLIAGKGHEDYQVIGTTKIHFSDVEEAEKAVKLR